MNWTVSGMWLLGELAAVGVAVLGVGALRDRNAPRVVYYAIGGMALIALVAGIISGQHIRVVAG